MLAARLRPQTIAAGETIFDEGDADDALYIIARGVVRISRRESNDWRHLTTLMAGDFFGEGALLERRPRRATVTAVTPCALYLLRRSDFDLLIDVYPHIRRTLEREDRRRKLASDFADDAQTAAPPAVTYGQTHSGVRSDTTL